MGKSKKMSSFNSIENPWSSWHQKIHARLLRYPNLLPKDSDLLLAISGGQDSMALLKIILDLRRIYKWNMFIWHGNHGWHENSKVFKNELQNWCNFKDLIFLSNETSKDKTSSEEKAREWRYKCLTERAEEISNKTKNKNKITYVLTGHTGSDKAETFILNLARGTDIKGLCSIPESRELGKNIQLVRPLLSLNREETAQICKDFSLPILLDPTNENKEISRNRVRHEIIPILEKIHPGCSLRISALAERISHSKIEKEALLNFILENIKLNSGISRNKLNTFPIQVRITILAHWIYSIGAPSLSTKSLEELIIKMDLKKAKGSSNFGKIWSITWEKDFIVISNSLNNKS
tara:strand:- start:245 stop:1294 length:1050 start_codon:yes stop_codon:yes gene_type:complete